jgi:hypothetical protein
LEAAPGIEPGNTALQAVALTTWLCRLILRAHAARTRFTVVVARPRFTNTVHEHVTRSSITPHAIISYLLSYGSPALSFTGQNQCQRLLAGHSGRTSARVRHVRSKYCRTREQRAWVKGRAQVERHDYS